MRTAAAREGRRETTPPQWCPPRRTRGPQQRRQARNRPEAMIGNVVDEVVVEKTKKVGTRTIRAKPRYHHHGRLISSVNVNAIVRISTVSAAAGMNRDCGGSALFCRSAGVHAQNADDRFCSAPNSVLIVARNICHCLQAKRRRLAQFRFKICNNSPAKMQREKCESLKRTRISVADVPATPNIRELGVSYTQVRPPLCVDRMLPYP